MTWLTSNTFAKSFLLLLLAQQGFGSFALAAAEVFQHEGGEQGIAVAHDCASMNMQAEGHSVSHDGATGSSQHDHQGCHDHQDCIDEGCDDCVGCIACAVGYRSSLSLNISSRPVVVTVSVAAPLPEAELLYRPPISI